MQAEISFPPFEPRKAHSRIRPIFLPFHGCPGKCIYCAQNLQSGTRPASLEVLYSRLKESFQQAADRQAAPFEAAFYGGTFTCIPPPWPQRFIALAQEFRERGLISRIRCSTRPDALEERKLLELKALGLECIELGIQTFSDRVLSLSRRGYTGRQAVKGCELVLEKGLELGIQLLPGLPGHEPGIWLEDIRRTIARQPALVRIYPCLVLKGTPLHRRWSSGGYRPWTLQETRQALNRGVFRLYRAGIPAARIGLAPEPGLLENMCAGPWHPALGSVIKSRVLFAVLLFKAAKLGPGPKRLFCPQKHQGQLFGHQGQNLNRLQRIGIQPADIRYTEQEIFTIQKISV